MMPASLILAAALATWGPIKMGTLRGFPYPPAMLRGEQSSPTPHAITAASASIAAGTALNRSSRQNPTHAAETRGWDAGSENR